MLVHSQVGGSLGTRKLTRRATAVAPTACLKCVVADGLLQLRIGLPPQYLPEAREQEQLRPLQERQAGEEQDAEEQQEAGQDSLGVRMALAALQFYRRGISPLMPSVCRYLPTCSQYSMQSYKRFGVWKGSVLTTWRLLRCNPWGSSGYDPPVWPPPGLELVFRYDNTDKVAVLLGAALVVRLVHAIIWE